MVIIGIDPGLTRCGYAVLSQNGTTTKPLAMDVINTPKEDSTPDRLAQLHTSLTSLFDKFSPDTMAIERVFIEFNRKTGTAVTQAAGIAMAIASIAGCEISEYSPKEVKKAVTSWGGADKQQVQEMVKLLLGLAEIPKPADVADAAAVALCHLAQPSPTLIAQ